TPDYSPGRFFLQDVKATAGRTIHIHGVKWKLYNMFKRKGLSREKIGRQS
ncbi:hypothetical protein CLOSTHATH_02565, partial [Hungatella hathewayi DSM 13479]